MQSSLTRLIIVPTKSSLSNYAEEVQLFGAARCHKTKFYLEYLDDKELKYAFYDVEKEQAHASKLKSLYENGKLNFPTFVINGKRLRNPSMKELQKWIDKMNEKPVFESPIIHDESQNRYLLPIEGSDESAYVEYRMRNETMYLVHSEVPFTLRGQGIGRRLVTETKRYLEHHGIAAIPTCGYIRYIYSKLENDNDAEE